MADTRLQLNNKEIVGRALDIVQHELQSMIIAQMKLKHNLDWWGYVTSLPRVEIPEEAKAYTCIEDADARRFMDITVCYWILKDSDVLSAVQRKQCNSALYNAKVVRNSKSHTGKLTYTVKEAQDAIQELIQLDVALGLMIGPELQSLYDSVTEEDAPVAKPAAVSESMIAEIKAEPTVTLAKFSPSPIGYDLREACMRSCAGMYASLSEVQKEKYNKSRIITETTYIVRGGAYILTLQNGIPIDDSTGVIIDGQEFSGCLANFSGYDKSTRKVTMYPSQALQAFIKEGSVIGLYSDMKWLVQKTGSFFDDYGSMVRFPPKPEVFASSSLLSSNFMHMSRDQIGAVKMILAQPLSYVWGVPGSGKTQYVLATAINECVRRGERVAVIAPTNQSLEQVLKGLMKSFGEQKVIDPKKDLVRIGTPTAEFIREFPSICEDKKVRSDMTDKIAAKNYYADVISERAYDALRASVNDAMAFLAKMDGSQASAEKLYAMLKPLLDVMNKDRRFDLNAKRVNIRNVRELAGPICKMIYERDRSKFFEGDVADLTDEKLRELVSKLDSEIAKLYQSDPKADIDTCKVISMTLSKFLISFGPEACSGRAKLNVNRVFVDEAGYCNALQLLGVFTLGVPVTLLGDHMQLPPVCEIEDKKLKEDLSIEAHRYDFFWDLSALFVERFFAVSTEDLVTAYEKGMTPDTKALKYTSVARLVSTYRFGQNLANSLGRMIYETEIKSRNTHNLEIEVLDARIEAFPMNQRLGKAVRENSAEKAAIESYILREHPTDYVVLAPYNDQVRLLQRSSVIPKEKVLTIHKSQGREWDTVIISVCDGRACNEDKPPRFTSTTQDVKGKQVINTAISRAKKKLVIACDSDYWSAIEGELIGDIAKNYGPGCRNAASRNL